jgi:hypothetical protein
LQHEPEATRFELPATVFQNTKLPATKATWRKSSCLNLVQLAFSTSPASGGAALPGERDAMSSNVSFRVFHVIKTSQARMKSFWI